MLCRFKPITVFSVSYNLSLMLKNIRTFLEKLILNSLLVNKIQFSKICLVMETKAKHKFLERVYSCRKGHCKNRYCTEAMKILTKMSRTKSTTQREDCWKMLDMFYLMILLPSLR